MIYMIEFEDAQEIAADFVREKKNVTEVYVTITEQKDGIWIVRGTCPINLEGHQWVEKFAVVLDVKGKIKTTDFALL